MTLAVREPNILVVHPSLPVREKFCNVSVETVGSTPEEFGVLVKSEMARLGKVIRDAGLRDK